MKSILVSTLYNLGDVVMSTAAVSLLREKFPDAKIDVLVRPESAEILRHNPDVSEVIVYAYKSKKVLHNLGEIVSVIRSKRYDAYLSLDRRLRSALIAFFARIPLRIGPDSLFRNSKRKLWTRWLYNRIVPMGTDDCANTTNMFQCIVRRAFDISGSRPVRELPVLPECAAKADRILNGASLPIIGLSVRANFSLKSWLPERFAGLMTRLKEERSAFLYVTGAPSDREYIDKIIEMCPAGTAMNLAGETSVMDMVALGAKSDLFITLDTGAVHVIGQSGVPRLICIMCCTCPEIIIGSVPRANIIWTGERCSPCHNVQPQDCPESPCIYGIAVDKVYDEAIGMLDSPAEAS